MTGHDHPLSHDPSSAAFPPSAEIETLIARGHALRAEAIRDALRGLGRLVWRAWTAGIRDVEPADAVHGTRLAAGGCD